ncbi:MAG: cation:proton antiporter, partial [Thermoleophilaceae bacterium]|nr:cation:proton antiporter [Thermoleophilaceae bacterium]
MDHQFEIVLLGLLVSVVGLLLLATWTHVPYPILLVLGGLGIGFVPGVPAVELEPDLVLLIFLPPLLYGASFFSSLRNLRANLRPISLLAVGLVLATMVSVALVAHLVIGLAWPVAFVLGAIVSPTDPVAATAIAARLGAPRRVVTIIEGESLINDGTALVAYRFALGAVLSGSFSLWMAGLQFVLSAIGGVAV